MNKREFEKYMLKNLDSVECIHCNIVESFDMDDNPCCWLDVYLSGYEYVTIFCSDDFPLDSKEVVRLQKSWVKKLDSWINPNWGIKKESVRMSI